MSARIRPGQRWLCRTREQDGSHREVTVLSVGGGEVTVQGAHRSTMPLPSLIYRFEMVAEAVDEQGELFGGDPTPLWQVREKLAEDRHEGTTCPACDQHVKVYRRKLTAQMGRFLIVLASRSEAGYVHIPALGVVAHGDATKARYWDLIEAPPATMTRDDGSNRVGYWRLTTRGHAFVAGLARVPKYALLYDGKLLELDDSETVDIHDVLGTTFNYDELMKGA